MIDCLQQLGCGIGVRRDGDHRVALHRLKRRYRDALMVEILATVEDPADAKDEIRHLMDALATS